ncbi:MAG: NACHT domain-containing protein [Coleofasciculus sp. A1-SPW-01]
MGKEQQPQQVQRPWDMSVKVGEQRSVQLPPQTTILDVFDNPTISGKFLILGKPGGGKTTTLLELAEALIERAEGDSDAPIPVILELSSWQEVTKPKFLPFGEREKYDPSIKKWVLSQLMGKGVSQEIGEQWLQDKELVLLLDGLDELQPERQAKCVRAINQFLSSELSPSHLVVCSRKEEYEDYEEILLLNGAICLEDLTNEQIRDYFTSVNLGEFWESIKGSEKIVNFIRQPLFLAITSIAYQQIDVEEWRNCNAEKNSIDYLLGIYRVKMLTRYCNKIRKEKSINNFMTSQNIIIFIAKSLTNTRFEYAQKLAKNRRIGKGNKVKLKAIRVDQIDTLIFNDLGWELIVKVISSFAVLIFYSGLLYLAISLDINSKHENIIDITHSFSNILIELVPLLLIMFPSVGTSFDFFEQLKSSNVIWKKRFGDIIEFQGYLTVLLFFIQFGLWVLFGWDDYGFNTWSNWIHRSVIIDNAILITWFMVDIHYFCGESSALPQYWVNIKLDLKYMSGWTFITLFLGIPLTILFAIIALDINMLLISFSACIAVYFLGFICQFNKILSGDIGNSKNIIFNSLLASLVSFIIGFMPVFVCSLLLQESTQVSAGYGITVGLIVSFWAMVSVIEYFVLRLTLWLTGQMPWNITRFLDYCTERLILQRVGNRYRFIHRLVQEHFAKLEIQKE